MRLSILTSVISTFLCGLCYGAQSTVNLATYRISKKPVHTVSDRFLSFTVDLNTIIHVINCQTTNTMVNMYRSLKPSYIRLAGPDTNNFVFHDYLETNELDLNLKPNDVLISSDEWLRLNKFLSKTQMDVIASVSDGDSEDWPPTNTRDLIEFSAKHNISLDWQLGYELQRFAANRGKSMGRDVARLRKFLDNFPIYRTSSIIGPDMISFNTTDDVNFLKNYLSEAANSLNAITWHPFSDDEDERRTLVHSMITANNALWMTKDSSSEVVPKKDIWIAESDTKDSISYLTDAMIWIRRMGTAASLGASVYLRKPHLLTFYEPTPEYWVAIFYKSLVGKTVLDIEQSAGKSNENIDTFVHCTQISQNPQDGIINPIMNYEYGSVTVYGVNTGSESVHLSFGVGTEESKAHLYILTEDTTKDFPITLLNNQVLDLSQDNELPMVSAKILDSKHIVIPGHSVFFVILLNANCQSCLLDYQDDSIMEIQVENQPTDTTREIAQDETDTANYITYPKRQDMRLSEKRELDLIDSLIKERNELMELRGKSDFPIFAQAIPFLPKETIDPFKFTYENLPEDFEKSLYETRKRSAPFYVIPLNNDTTPDIVESFQNGEFKQTIPVVNLYRNPVSEFERTKRGIEVENQTVTDVEPDIVYIVESLDDQDTSPLTELDKTRLANESSTDGITQQNVTSVPDILSETDGSQVTRNYREITLDNDEPTVGSSNFRPVSPFPKKPKSVKKIKPRTSDNVQLHRSKAKEADSILTESTTTTKSTPIERSETPREDPVLESKLLVTKTETESESETDLVSKPIPTISSKKTLTSDEKDFDNTFKRLTASLNRIKNEAVKSIMSPQARNEKSKVNSAPILKLYEKLIKDDLDRLNTRMKDLNKRLDSLHSDSRHKREVIEDVYETTKNFLTNVGDNVNTNFKSIAHWLGEKSIGLGADLVRTRRDLKSSSKPDLKELKDLLESRRNEIHKKLEKIAEDYQQRKSAKKNRNRRDLQPILQQIQERKQLRDLLRNEHRQKLQKLVEERKLNHKLVRNKRQTPVTERLDEVIRKNHVHHPKPKNLKVLDTPNPTKSKTTPTEQHVAKDESHSPLSTDKPKISESPQPKIDKPMHHATINRSRAARKEAMKQKLHHNGKRDAEDTLDSKPDLQMRHFAEPALNSKSPCEDSKREKRSLDDNEILDDEDNSEIGMKIDNEYHNAKLNHITNFKKREQNDSTSLVTEQKKFHDESDEHFDKASTHDNRTCQFVNYNIFSYLWCLAGKLFSMYFRNSY